MTISRAMRVALIALLFVSKINKIWSVTKPAAKIGENRRNRPGNGENGREKVVDAVSKQTRQNWHGFYVEIVATAGDRQLPRGIERLCGPRRG